MVKVVGNMFGVRKLLKRGKICEEVVVVVKERLMKESKRGVENVPRR
jgi:hypothetical protein